MSNTIREYRVEEKLSDGRMVVIQLVDSNDKTVYTEQTYHLSRSALYLKFLTPARELNERELAYLTDCNLYRHVALFAAIENNGRVVPVGVGRYVVPASFEPSGSAELAFAVSDEFLGCGIETILLSHLRRLAKEDGIQAFFARVPVANQQMLDVLRKFDQELITVQDSRVSNVLLPV